MSEIMSLKSNNTKLVNGTTDYSSQENPPEIFPKKSMKNTPKKSALTVQTTPASAKRRSRSSNRQQPRSKPSTTAENCGDAPLSGTKLAISRSNSAASAGSGAGRRAKMGGGSGSNGGGGGYQWTPHKRRGPIAAEFSGPGPASIALPSLIGSKSYICAFLTYCIIT